MNILNEASEAVIIDCEAHPSLLLLAPEGYWKSVHWVCGNGSGSGAECIRRSSDRDRKPARNEGLIAPSTPRRPSRPPFGRRRPQAVHREYRSTGDQGDCARKREPGNPTLASRPPGKLCCSVPSVRRTGSGFSSACKSGTDSSGARQRH